MKILTFMSMVACTVLASNAAFASPSGFTCERIKEKSVRAACVKERQAKEEAESADKVQAAAEKIEQERQQELIAEKKRASNEFVSKAKGLLVQNLKDPESAKFTNLVIAHGPNRRLLCGSINAKNSYGGYVGAKKFFVLWDDPSQTSPEVYTDGDEVARATIRMNELSRVSPSAGLSAQIEAAQEADRLMAKVKLEVARNAKILSEQCAASADTTITAVEN